MTFLFGFLPAVLILYYALPKRFKNILLMISGLFFYAWGEPVYVFLMILTVMIDWGAGIWMERLRDKRRARLGVLVASVVLNLSFLGVFKYASFFIQTVNTLFGLALADPQLPLPIGISFYTFQAMSYTLDLYRGKIRVQRNPVNFAAYVTLFPQLIAGPIVRYSEVENEIDDRKIGTDQLADGIGIFIQGLAKKVLLANNIGLVWTAVKATNYSALPALTAWIGILAFTFQIYYDFSGYSDMAVGLGKMLGFHFPQNFAHPYMAHSISEFWRRWHITMGNWFKSYVYIPLGGNREGRWKTVRNLAVVWALTGLWHGASWNFVLWGLYFGVLIILEKFVWGRLLARLPSLFQWLYTFLLVVLGWVLFEMRENSLAAIGGYFSALFGGNGASFATNGSFYLLLSNLVLFILCAAGAGNWMSRLRSRIEKRNPAVACSGIYLAQLLLFGICICYLVTSTYNPFLYYNI